MTSLYLHIPFCARKCFYCSFAVVVGQQAQAARYLNCLEKEAGPYSGEKIFSVYLGGGTPSVLGLDDLIRLDDIINQHFNCSDIQEKTIELNPEDVDDGKARLIKKLKFNRISLGVQSFDDHCLKFLGRAHNSRQVLAAFDILRKADHQNINVDMMYALPGQTLQDVKRDFTIMAGLRCEHVSLYSLTVEEHSRFFVKEIQPVPQPQQTELYQWALGFLSDNGFRQYEISNFAMPQKESRHNLHYWQGGNYIGLGLAAHAHHNGRRSWNVSRLKEYLLRVESGKVPTEDFEILGLEKQMWERIVFGLRLNSGIDLENVQGQYQQKISKKKWDKIHEFVSCGFLAYEAPYLKTTFPGRLILDELSAYLI